jgi:2-methylcitrate dehydratase PrpD
MSETVSERLVAFSREWVDKGVPEPVLHEAKRLLLNHLKASVGATDNPAIKIIHDWAVADGAGKSDAHILWLGTKTGAAQAAMVNGALFEVLDFHDTYVPTFLHAVSAILPAVLAEAEVGGQSGRQVLTALALGIEIELAIATILMPTGYYRGYVPAGLVGGVGAAAACSILAGFDAIKMRNALGMAMCTAFGLYESVGSMGLSYVTGATARSGLTAYQLAARGFDGPATAFEGEKGMFVTHCDENPEKVEGVLASLGKDWRIFGQSYKTMPTETITHCPIECTLAIRKRANGREIERMRFHVQPIVVKIADERRARFGNPSSDLQARFDTRYCAAAAWERGYFTLAEMQEPSYTDPTILALRDKIDLLPDEARQTFNGCSLEVEFTDGSKEFVNIDFFLGTPENPMSDDQLLTLFRNAANAAAPGKAETMLDAVWGMDKASDIRGLMSLLAI